MNVTAVARRVGGWWAVEVPELPGLFTQAKRLDQVVGMVADAAELAGYPGVTVSLDVHLAPENRAVVADAKAKRENLRAAEQAAASASRAAARRLRGDGLTVRDVAQLMGITAQRASQLLAS